MKIKTFSFWILDFIKPIIEIQSKYLMKNPKISSVFLIIIATFFHILAKTKLGEVLLASKPFERQPNLHKIELLCAIEEEAKTKENVWKNKTWLEYGQGNIWK